MEEKNQGHKQFTKPPAIQVRKVVFFAVLMVATMSFLWHDLGMLEARESTRVKEQALLEKISKLTLYRDSLSAIASTTNSTQLKAL